MAQVMQCSCYCKARSLLRMSVAGSAAYSTSTQSECFKSNLTTANVGKQQQNELLFRVQLVNFWKEKNFSAQSTCTPSTNFLDKALQGTKQWLSQFRTISFNSNGTRELHIQAFLSDQVCYRSLCYARLSLHWVVPVDKLYQYNILRHFSFWLLSSPHRGHQTMPAAAYSANLDPRCFILINLDKSVKKKL